MSPGLVPHEPSCSCTPPEPLLQSPGNCFSVRGSHKTKTVCVFLDTGKWRERKEGVREALGLHGKQALRHEQPRFTSNTQRSAQWVGTVLHAMTPAWHAHVKIHVGGWGSTRLLHSQAKAFGTKRAAQCLLRQLTLVVTMDFPGCTRFLFWVLLMVNDQHVDLFLAYSIYSKFPSLCKANEVFDDKFTN